MKKILLVVGTLILATSLWAQTKIQDMYIEMGNYQNFSYEAQLAPTTVTAKSRNRVLTGEYKDYYVITEWLYDCRTNSLQQVSRSTFDPKGTLLAKDDKKYDWLNTEKGSFGRTMLEKYWCKDLN